MSEALFLRLLPYEDKSSVLAETIAAIHDNHYLNSVVYAVDPTSFSQVPDSPFAYWVSEHIRHVFTELPAFENEGRTVKQGLATADDFRFVRLWWEVKPENTVSGTSTTRPEQFLHQTFKGRRWIPLAKGGSYSPYYSDIHLVVDWKKDAEELKNFKDPQTGKPFSYLRNTDFYFRSGLTWSRRTSRGISVRILPQGCTFADKGPAAFAEFSEQKALLALMNTQAFESLVAMQLGAADAAARSYEVGLIQKIPVPDLTNSDSVRLGELAMTCVHLKRNLDTANETSHVFNLSTLLQVKKNTLSECITSWQIRVTYTKQQLIKYQREIDDIAFRLYGITDEERQIIEESQKGGKQSGAGGIDEEAGLEEDESLEASTVTRNLVTDLLSYAVGCALGRWDLSLARDARPTLKLLDPFAPMPVYSPGMLIGHDGLPATQDRIVSEEWLRTHPDAITLPPEGTVQQPTIQGTQYPITVAWDGILVDDMDHSADIVRSVREVLAALWPSEDGAESEAIEREASKILGVKDLREYFRRQVGFFANHLKRYSKSRRQAPIYWPLSTASGSYTLWIYYHRLTSDTLFTAVNQYVDPKITEIQRKIGELEGRLTGTTVREATRLSEEVEDARALLAELQDFRAELLRVAALPYRPDLNDGVIINASPLHRLFRLPKWAKDTKACWEKLQRGEYDWAHLAYTIWPDRVREKCRGDRSLAIAHDLEHLYIEQPTIARRTRSRKAVPAKEDEE